MSIRRLPRSSRPRNEVRPEVVHLEGRCLLSIGMADPSFNGGAAVVLPLGAGVGETSDFLGQTLQPDGKVLILGRTSSPGVASPDILRLDADGALDPAFDGDGRLTIAGRPDLDGLDVNRVLLQPDGKILLIGGAPAGIEGSPEARAAAIVRLNPDGSPDPTFAEGGRLVIAQSLLGSGAAVEPETFLSSAVAPDGKILAVGLFHGPAPLSINSVAYFRFLPDGSPDPTFGEADGRTLLSTFSVANTYRFVPSLIRFQGDKIVLAGDILYAFPVIGNGPQVTSRVFGVVRLEDSGALDPTFNDPNHIQSGVPDAGNTPGVVAVSYVYDASGKAPEGSTSHVSDMTVDSDGRILLAGSYATGGAPEIAVTRLDATGKADPTFGGDGASPGVAFLAIGPRSEARSIALDAVGGFLVAGTTTATGPTTLALARYDRNGALDPNFPSGGSVATDSAVPDSGPLAFDSSARIVASGSPATDQVSVARFDLADRTAPAPPIAPPTVSDFAIRTRHGRLRTLSLTYNAAMDGASAADPGSYRLIWAGRDRRFGSRDDRVLRLRSANYDASKLTVTLAPRKHIPTHLPLELIARGAALRGANGALLTGTSDMPGTDFIRLFGAKPRPARR